MHLGSAVRYGAMTYNGEVDAVGGVVMMLKGANSADVVSRIKDKMSTIQKSLPFNKLYNDKYKLFYNCSIYF